MSISTLDHEFVRTFRLVALQAGAVARHLQGKVKAERKGSGTPESDALTAVDLATQDVILHLLHDRMPEVAMDAEEDTPALSLFERPDPQAALVVVDPVDGTLNYIRRSDDYAVMGALLREQRYTAAVIYFPAYGTCYWAVDGTGCFSVNAAGREELRKVGEAPARILHAPRTP